MKSIRHIAVVVTAALAAVIATGGVGMTSAAPAGAATTDDWATVEAILNRHPVAYTAPSPISNTTNHTPDGPLMGNGTVEAFMGGDRNVQKIYLSRKDMWEDQNATNRDVHYTTLGGLTIATPSTVASGTFRYDQTLTNGVVTAASERGFTSRTWLSATENVLVTEVQNMTTAVLPVDFSTWTVASTVNPATLTGGSLDAPNKLVVSTKSAVSTIYDWSVNVAVASKVIGKTASLSTTDTRTEKTSFSLAAGETVTIVTAVEGGKNSTTAVADATNKVLARSTTAAITTLRTAHDAWWKDYWQKSYISLDTASQDLENVYYGELYMLGCAIGAKSEHDADLTAGLFPWTANVSPDWQGDFTMNTDVQRPIHVSVAANRISNVDSYSQVISDFWPTAQSLAASKDQLNYLISGTGHPTFTAGIRGAMFPTHLGPWGSRTEHSNNANDYYHSPTNGASAVMPLVKYWRYTQDDDFLQNTLYPMLKDLAHFWQDYVVWDSAASQYVVYGATFEGSGHYKNAILDLMAANFVFTSAIDASTALGADSADRATWADIRSKLSPYPTGTIASGAGAGKITYVEAAGMTPAANSNPEVIHGSYFFGGVKRTDTVGSQYIRDYISYLQQWNSDKAMRAAVSATSVGFDISSIVGSIRTNILNPAPSDWLGVRKNNTYGDVGASIYLGFIDSSLMQSDDGYIHVFANWYKNQAASFTNLRANGAFLVSASQDAAGVVTKTTIRSEKGKQLTVFNPWQGKQLKVLANGTPIATVKSANSLGELYSFPTTAGVTYELQPVATATNQWNAQAGAAAVTGDFNHDGKADIAVRESGGNVYIRYGTGTGTFANQTQTTLASTGSYYAGDVGGDGSTDIGTRVASNWTWVKGTGAGTFSQPSQFTWAANSQAQFLVADFDGDQKADIAAWEPAGYLYVKYGTGLGDFNRQSLQTGWVASSTYRLAADFNGDGKADIAVWDPTASTWKIRNGDGAGHFGSEWRIATAAPSSTVIPLAGDVDGGGRADIILWNQTTGVWTTYFTL